uniref:Very-long-chain (3R)-3-hydroxyacyl-CoA dehydratase n=1 Tax=Nelumbo nucifera TaxID=4432 RepID=A0A822XXJ0_NELNU|nr:TPA_asm: hypothetical protein HUJ06_023571 [Nelumbo nucifera]
MAGFLSVLRRLYFTAYNWAVCVGWCQVLYFALKTLRESGHERVHDAVERPLQLAQTAAILEIFHGLIGLVRSPITATLPQIGSRLYLTWGILYSFPEYSIFFLRHEGSIRLCTILALVAQVQHLFGIVSNWHFQ